MKPPRSQSLWRVFRWPLVLMTFSIVGLVTALVGDTRADIVSWVLLGSLLVTLIWGTLRRP